MKETAKNWEENSLSSPENVKQKALNLIRELWAMEKADEVDLSSLKQEEKVGIIIRAGDTDVFAQRMVALVIEKRDNGFQLRMSWRTLNEGIKFDQEGMPKLPADLREILLTEKQIVSPLRLPTSITKNSTNWTKWKILDKTRQTTLLMGYAEAFSPATVE